MMSGGYLRIVTAVTSGLEAFIRCLSPAGKKSAQKYFYVKFCTKAHAGAHSVGGHEGERHLENMGEAPDAVTGA